MTTERIAALVLAVVFFAAPALASAQHEPVVVERPVASHATTDATASHAPHLTDAHEQLRPPSPEEWVLPVGSIVLGGAMVIAGAIFTVGSLLGLALEGTAGIFGGGDDTTVRNLQIVLGGSLAGLAVGAVLIAVGATHVAELRHRTRETSGPNVEGFSLAPTQDGFAVGAWGTF
jgi:hypothetical protein